LTWLAGVAIPAGIVLAFAFGWLLANRRTRRHADKSWRFTIDLWRSARLDDEPMNKEKDDAG
jgi:hypothetical protein